ncbi:MAG: penicillin acylase family protein [Candidatus Hydrogenedentes bacterium]|nr:penicillin acylase family protein [Candidatus Hydrogenedentota bacterium]
MTKTLLMRAFFAVVLATFAGAASAELPGVGEDAGKIVIYRDTWGVPHIYALTVEGGFYAMGWAQAEDRPVELLKNLLRGLGELASVEGPGGADSDQIALTWNLYEKSKGAADQLNPETRAQTQAYARGVNAYYKAHPEDVPEWWGNRQADEFMVMAFGRLFLENWSYDDGFDDLKRGGIERGFDRISRGSNQWAVSPKRSATGAAILYVDPHLGWFGSSRFWEYRIHAGEWVGSGFTLAGQPFIGLGHNENVAWAMTTGGPDTADVYELTLNETNPMQYLYDGAWRDITKREVTLAVKGENPRVLTLLDCHYGPVVAIRNGKGYAIKSAYADAVKASEAWFGLCTAKDYHGAEAAMATLQFFPQNVMVADTSGNIYYQRTGRVPERAPQFDWTRPVNGSTSATEWDGFHPSSDHLQVLNPPQGFMQNCNIPPDAMMPDSPFSLEKTIPYLWADLSHNPQRSGWGNQRGARAVQLLASDESVTVEEALAYAVDIHPFGCERWIDVLRMADEKHGGSLRANPDYAAGIDDLLQWDQQLSADSTGALKYYYWRKQMIDDHGAEVMDEASRRVDNYLEPVGRTTPPLNFTSDELAAAATSLANAMKQLKSDFGSLDKTYGDVFRVGRDDASWPVEGGGDKNKGMTTLRNVGFERERTDHTRWGNSGQTSTQLIVLSKPVQSWTFAPVGQSDRPDSPHYRDQAEKAFSPRQLKDTWWTPEELTEHVESREVLTP